SVTGPPSDDSRNPPPDGPRVDAFTLPRRRGIPQGHRWAEVSRTAVSSPLEAETWPSSRLHPAGGWGPFGGWHHPSVAACCRGFMSIVREESCVVPPSGRRSR